MDKEELIVDGLYVRLGGQPVLNGVYLRVPTGTITALFGRNGCGKSTLLNCVSGVLHPDAMVLSYGGRRSNDYRAIRRDLLFVPQADSLPGYLSVGNLLTLYGVAGDAVGRIEATLAVGRGDRVENLSVGTTKLVHLFAALNAAKKLILLDEPFAGLAPVAVEALQRELRRAKLQRAILLTDHQYRSVWEVADRSFLMREGRLFPVAKLEDLVDGGYLAEP